MPEPILSVRDLQTYFTTDEGVVKAVDGVSFDMLPGQTLGIVGESGSGKSVTCLSVMRLIECPPGSHPGGQVLFHGQNLLTATESTLRSVRGNRISMIFQDPMTSLNPFLSIGRQLTEVLQNHKRMTATEARKRAIAMIDRVGISEAASRFSQYPHEFSGGMRQRIMVAMALLCEPELLIADEPTTALDVTIQAQILDLISDLQSDFATSVILITHDLGVVAGTADHVAVMYAGKIIEHGATEQIFADPMHPYTRALLKSVPRLDDSATDELYAIPGLPPDLTELPSGCPFHPRCDEATDNCERIYPERIVNSLGHWAACSEIKTDSSKT